MLRNLIGEGANRVADFAHDDDFRGLVQASKVDDEEFSVFCSDVDRSAFRREFERCWGRFCVHASYLARGGVLNMCEREGKLRRRTVFLSPNQS